MLSQILQLRSESWFLQFVLIVPSVLVCCSYYGWHLKWIVEHALDSEAEGNDSRSSQWTTGFRRLSQPEFTFNASKGKKRGNSVFIRPAERKTHRTRHVWFPRAVHNSWTYTQLEEQHLCLEMSEFSQMFAWHFQIISWLCRTENYDFFKSLGLCQV